MTMRVDLLKRRPKTGKLSRDRKIVYSRALYYGLCRELTSLSYAEIGATLGQDHATVLNGVKNIYDNFISWNEVDYITACETVRSQIDNNVRARYVEDIIRENIRLKRENNELKKRAYVLPNRRTNSIVNANV